MIVLAETMNEGQRPGLKDIANGIVEKLGFGPSKTELIEQRIIPEIFALAIKNRGDLSAISSTHTLEIPLSRNGNEEGKAEKKVTFASMRNLDLTGVLPDCQLKDGKKPALEEIAAALKQLSGNRAVQEASEVSKRMREKLGPQDLYTFTVLVNGESQNVSYITRRGSIKFGFGLLSGAVLTACADALRRVTLPPPGVSTQRVEPTPLPTPEAFRTVSIQDVVPAFSEAKQLSIGSDGFYVPVSSATEEKIRVTRISETQFTFGEPGKQITVNFQPDAVDVGLSFGGAERPVMSHGMASIIDPADSLTLKYIRQSLGVSEAETLSFVGGSGTDLGGVPLRGMSFMHSITTPQETKPTGWIFSPWLTSPDVIAENEIKGGPYIAYYKSGGNGKSEFLTSVPLKNLLVKMDAHQKLIVSSDGRYILDNGNDDFTPVAAVWRKQGVPEDVISYYENLFVPAVSAEEWASDKETGQVKPENMFPLVGAINHKNRYTLDLGFGTMRLAVAQDKDLAQIASHRDLRGIVGLDLDNNLELRKHLLTIRSNFAKLVEFKGKKDFKDLTLIIEGGVVTLAVLKLRDELRKYKVDAEGNITLLKKEEEPRLLPELKVEGHLIKRADTGETVTLKGLNVTDFAYDRIGSFNRIWDRGLQTITEQRWPVNLLRVGINSEYIYSQLSEVDKLVDYAEKHGMYVWFHTHREGDKQLPLPSEKVRVVMENLATRYSNRNHILYGLFNEPSPETQVHEETGVWPPINQTVIQRWIDVAQPIADAIRTANPEAIIVVPGHSRSAHELDYYINHPFEINGSTENVVYDVHVYGQIEKPDQQPFFNDNSARRFIAKKQKPLIFGEFAGVVTEGSPLMQGKDDIGYMQQIIDLINANPGAVHYTAWSLDSFGRSGALLPPNYTNRSPRGEVIYEDLLKVPPTLFNN